MNGASSKCVHTRVLVKLSGEAFGESGSGVGVDRLKNIVSDLTALTALGVEVAVVIGAGNLIRGVELASAGFDQFTADQMGILCTVVNGLALREALQHAGHDTSLYSSLMIPTVAKANDRMQAMQDLEQGKIVIFSGGTGTPFFTTDTTASLRAIDIKADIVLKATTVDGVYSADPKQDKNATRFDRLSYCDVIEKKLRVMDLAAICLCRDHDMPVRVFDMNKSGVLKNIVLGEAEGTLISN